MIKLYKPGKKIKMIKLNENSFGINLEHNAEFFILYYYIFVISDYQSYNIYLHTQGSATTLGYLI